MRRRNCEGHHRRLFNNDAADVASETRSTHLQTDVGPRRRHQRPTVMTGRESPDLSRRSVKESRALGTDDGHCGVRRRVRRDCEEGLVDEVAPSIDAPQRTQCGRFARSRENQTLNPAHDPLTTSRLLTGRVCAVQRDQVRRAGRCRCRSQSGCRIVGPPQQRTNSGRHQDRGNN
jgi:hypothetical protein